MSSVVFIVAGCLSCITVLPIAVFMVTKFAVAGYYSGRNYAHRRNYDG